MIEIKRIEPFYVELEGIDFKDTERVQTIMNICHEYKHRFMDGYPYGRKTRKKLGKKLERWACCPEICFVYLATSGSSKDGSIIIRVLVSSVEDLLDRYTRKELGYHVQVYLQEVTDRVIDVLGDDPNTN